MMSPRKYASVAGTATRRGGAAAAALASPVVVAAAATMIWVGMAPPAQAQCEPQWSEGRGFPGTNGPVYASAAWDPDGPGGQPPLAVVAGSFNIAGEVFANNVAAWNGDEWMPLGTGIPGTNTTIRALQVFDDGTGGPALYAGGFFNTPSGAPANYIARWDGANWSPVGTGMDGRVEALAVFDDGNGPALYAGGAFINAGGQPARFIAKWDGTNWSPVGTGMDNWVLALTVFDDGTGSGPALHAGGQFNVAGGVFARFVAKWDGRSWSDLDTFEVDGIIHSLTTYDDGEGTDLYAAGEFTFIGTLAVANFVARWNGTAWSSLGNAANDTIYRLAVFDAPGGLDGPALYAGGAFTSAGIVSANHIAAWDGAAWSSPGGGVNNTVTALAVVEGGEGRDTPTSIYVGGLFHATEDIAARHIARWDGQAWSNLGTGAGMNAPVYALTTFDDGSGPALHAAGGFTTAGTALASNVAKWDANSDESTWSPLDTGTNFLCQALAVYNDGSADALFAGGWFTTAGSAPANYIAQWNGRQWSSAGAGVSYIVRALAVFDDGAPGNGPALYAGGAFQSAGGAPAGFIARWDGTQWTPLSTGMNNMVYTLAVFDDGSGPALYAGGEFTTAGGAPANFIAKWDGKEWLPLGSGMNSAVYALTVFDDGRGPALYAGGFFSSAGGETANCIARWDGELWSPVGTGMAGGAFPAVLTLAVFDDGTGNGPALYAGGQFTTAGGAPANRIAKWTAARGRRESEWSALSTGLEGTSAPAVHALTVFDDGAPGGGGGGGGGPALYVGGVFDIAGGVVSAYWARWGCAPNNCPADLDRDGTVNGFDLGLLLGGWGQPGPADLDSDGVVDGFDLAILLGDWGPC